MLSNEDSNPHQTKRRSPIVTEISSVLGVISITTASIALIMSIRIMNGIEEEFIKVGRSDIELNDILLFLLQVAVEGFFGDKEAGRWASVLFLFLIVIFFSFLMSLIGIGLNNRSPKGERLCKFGLMLTFSPILMIIIIGWIHDK